MTILYEIHEIERFERVQNFASYARLVKCEKNSSGKRRGTGGAKVGNVHLKWAFSEAAVLFLRANPPAQKFVEKLQKKHGKAKALSHRLTEGSEASPSSNWSHTRDKTMTMPNFILCLSSTHFASWLNAPAAPRVDWHLLLHPTTFARGLVFSRSSAPHPIPLLTNPSSARGRTD
jgi:hypothetical protein